MDFADIDKLMEERLKEVKKEKNQLGYGFAVILGVIILSFLLWRSYYVYAVSLGIGLMIGIVLRYTRFCFAGAFRDMFITGNTKVIRAVILGLIVSTIGFGLIQARHIPAHIGDYGSIPGAVNPVGLHIMLGAFIFGIGMVLAGGCASGLLMRLGEGHTIHLVVLIGIIIGNLLGAKDYGFWHKLLIKNTRPIYFPDYLNLKMVMALQVGVLMILYIGALWYEKKYVRQNRRQEKWQ